MAIVFFPKTLYLNISKKIISNNVESNEIGINI